MTTPKESVLPKWGPPPTTSELESIKKLKATFDEQKRLNDVRLVRRMAGNIAAGLVHGTEISDLTVERVSEMSVRLAKRIIEITEEGFDAGKS